MNFWIVNIVFYRVSNIKYILLQSRKSCSYSVQSLMSVYIYLTKTWRETFKVSPWTMQGLQQSVLTVIWYLVPRKCSLGKWPPPVVYVSRICSLSVSLCLLCLVRIPGIIFRYQYNGCYLHKTDFVGCYLRWRHANRLSFFICLQFYLIYVYFCLLFIVSEGECVFCQIFHEPFT